MALDERKIKALLIDKILHHYDPAKITVAIELPFLGGKRWADVVVITAEQIIAYEIKSDLDSVRRLKEQSQDYSKTFHKLYIVTTPKHGDSAFIKQLPKNIGLISVGTTKKFKMKKRATCQTRLLKKNISYFLWSKDLRKLLQTNEKTSLTWRKKLTKKLNLKDMETAAINSLLGRYQQKFRLFLKHRGEYTHSEDLEILTKKDFVFS